MPFHPSPRRRPPSSCRSPLARKIYSPPCARSSWDSRPTTEACPAVAARQRSRWCARRLPRHRASKPRIEFSLNAGHDPILQGAPIVEFCQPRRRRCWAEIRREPVVLTSLYSLLRLVTLLAVLSLTAVAISVLLVTLVHA